MEAKFEVNGETVTITASMDALNEILRIMPILEGFGDRISPVTLDSSDGVESLEKC